MISFDWFACYFFKTGEKKIIRFFWFNWIAKEFREPENQTNKLPFNACQILKVNVKYGDRFCILVILAVMQVFRVTENLQITNNQYCKYLTNFPTAPYFNTPS